MFCSKRRNKSSGQIAHHCSGLNVVLLDRLLPQTLYYWDIEYFTSIWRCATEIFLINCDGQSPRPIYVIQVRELAWNIWKYGIKGVLSHVVVLPYLTQSVNCSACFKIHKIACNARNEYVHFSTNLIGKKRFRIKRLCPLWLTFGSPWVTSFGTFFNLWLFNILMYEICS